MIIRIRTIRHSVAFALLAASFGVLASCVSGGLPDFDNGGNAGQGNAHGGSQTAGAGRNGTSGAGGSTSIAGTMNTQGGSTGTAGSSNMQGGATGTAGSGSGGKGGGAGGKGGATGTAGKGGTLGVSGSSSAGATGNAGSVGTAGTTGNGMPLAPITGGSTGFATRYWDCCKPACAWPASQSMQSCDSNNNGQGKGNNNQSACQGGNSFMCYNYEPWVDPTNNYVAYGFVAASGGNYVCGRCFEVQFNGSGHSGGSNGLTQKTMFVQVINNGGVADNQFDILIPGGGVGALNACTTEWGSGADLGSQYGGLFNECNNNVACTQTKCNTVFAGKPDLLAGCNWFLTWFTAADNPNITFKQVSCPSQISSKSGMSGG